MFLVLDVEPLIDRIKNYAKNKLLCRIKFYGIKILWDKATEDKDPIK